MQSFDTQQKLHVADRVALITIRRQRETARQRQRQTETDRQAGRQAERQREKQRQTHGRTNKLIDNRRSKRTETCRNKLESRILIKIMSRFVTVKVLLRFHMSAYTCMRDVLHWLPVRQRIEFSS